MRGCLAGCVSRIEDLEAALPAELIAWEPIPLEVAFLVGKYFAPTASVAGRRNFIIYIKIIEWL